MVPEYLDWGNWRWVERKSKQFLVEAGYQESLFAPVPEPMQESLEAIPDDWKHKGAE